MLDDLRPRDYSPDTIRDYIRAVPQFNEFGRSPEQPGAEHIPHYHVHLLHEKKLLVFVARYKPSSLSKV